MSVNIGVHAMPEWHFYLPDSDRSAGWTNHCYVLQFVASGRGETPEQAWTNAEVPEGFYLPETLTAVRVDHEHELTVGA